MKYFIKKICSLALTAIFAILSSVTNSDLVTAETIEFIKERNELIACVSPRAEPYSDAVAMIETPEYPGIQIDLAKSLAKKLNVELSYKWIDGFFRANQVKCDLYMGLPMISKDDPPHPFLNKTKPYFLNKIIFVSQNNYKLKNISDFKGLKVAADTSTSAQDVLRHQNSGAELFVSYIEDSDKLEALQMGKIDVALVTSVSLGWYQKTHPEFKPVITPVSIITPVDEFSFVLGLYESNQATLATFNKLLNEMIEDNTIKKIFNHYGIKYEIKKY